MTSRHLSHRASVPLDHLGYKMQKEVRTDRGADSVENKGTL